VSSPDLTRPRAGVVPSVPSPEAGGTGRAGSAVTRLAIRLVRRGTALVAVVVAGMSAFVVLQYRFLAESLDPESLSELAGNPAVRTLFGVPLALGDPGGFAVWRTGTPVAVLVSVWALLAATRITRGQEEAGHWALLLSGRVPLPDVVLRHLAVLVGAQALVGGALAAALVATATRAPGALLYAGGIALTGTTFAAVGTLTAQLVPDRRLAAGIGGSVIGAALLLRMVSDRSPGWPGRLPSGCCPACSPSPGTGHCPWRCWSP
jgi:ABC-2 type transport system permease protein